MLNLSEKKTNHIVWTLLCLMPIVGMGIDLVAPSLPSISHSLNISTTVAKNVISIFLFGYAIGNFVIGLVTDSLGRKKLLRFVLFTFVLVSLIPIFFPNIFMLLCARFLQGFAMGGVAVLIRAISSDILPTEKLVRMGTLIGTMFGIGPVIGPVIGGYLQVYFGWKAGFYFFAVFSFIGFLFVFFIVPETLLKFQSLNVRTIKKNILEIISHRLFMALVLLMGLVYALIITFHTLGPFFIQVKLHYSPIFFGHLALYFGIVFLSATFICRFMLKRFAISKLYLLVINLFFLVATMGLILGHVFDNSVVLLSIVSALMFFTCGFIFPMSMGKGLALFRHIAGTASAVMYLINISITSMIGFLESFIHVESVIPIMWMYFLLLLISVIVYWTMVHRQNNL